MSIKKLLVSSLLLMAGTQVMAEGEGTEAVAYEEPVVAEPTESAYITPFP